ncbi:uncharacterized protein LTR77_006441 [Saxophila tyrrhenica]|uniref:NmrA-like domain-containing protein n=1 Tax=Saxophila tyrrhenica TaxID=1690608 RepID=A0AAV9PB06_9PEZI|nr:hypothetical protein LTR77_006441 [Saxophila tyrrhenica]
MAHGNGVHKVIKRVLILGDNYAGSSIIKALSQTDLEIHVAHQYAPASLTDGFTHHISDITTSLTSLFQQLHPDLIISTASGGSFSTQQNIIDSAIEAQVPRFVPAEFSHDSLNKNIQGRLPPSRERARTIEYLQQQAKAGRIEWVGVATGTTLDHGILSGNLGFDLKWQSATLHGQGHERFAASSSAWIGRAMLAIIEHWEDVKNQYLYASGLPTSGNEVVSALEKETGKTFTVGRADVEECIHEAERRLQQGFPDAGMFLMERSVLYDESLDAVRAFEEADAKEKLGLEAESLHDIVHGVLHDEREHGGKPGCGCD